MGEGEEEVPEEQPEEEAPEEAEAAEANDEEEDGNEGSDDEAGCCEKICGGLVVWCLGLICCPLMGIFIGVNERATICARGAIFEMSQWETNNCQNVQSGDFLFQCTSDANATGAQWTDAGATSPGAGVPNAWRGSLNASVRADLVSVAYVWEYRVCQRRTSNNVTTYSLEWSTSPQQALAAVPANSPCGQTSFTVGQRSAAVASESQALILGASYSTQESQVIAEATSSTTVRWHSSGCGETTATPPCARLRLTLRRARNTALTFAATSNGAGLITRGQASGAFFCGSDSRIDVQTGTLDSAKFNEAAAAQSGFAVWFFRVALLFGCCGSVYCCCSPISTGADIVGDWLEMIPCVGETLEDILEGAVEAIVICLSCIIGCSCGVFCIALMWAMFRPLIGLPILLCMCCVMGGAGYFAKSSENPNKEKVKKRKAKKKGNQAGAVELEGGEPLAEES